MRKFFSISTAVADPRENDKWNDISNITFCVCHSAYLLALSMPSAMTIDVLFSQIAREICSFRLSCAHTFLQTDCSLNAHTRLSRVVIGSPHKFLLVFHHEEMIQRSLSLSRFFARSMTKIIIFVGFSLDTFFNELRRMCVGWARRVKT